MARVKSMKRKAKITNTIIYILLAILCFIWVLPIAWIVFISFNSLDSRAAISALPPKGASLIQTLDFYFGDLTFKHYVNLFTSKTEPYLRWFFNTFAVAIVTMFINTFFIMSVAYTMSRLKFKGRKTLMSLNLILGMFPGFMSMIAIYNILKLVNLTKSLVGLTLCYTMSSGMGFYIAKGFFDTVPKSLDEAARIDGASKCRTFFKIILPLSKSIIIYTILISFIAPWCDYIFVSFIMAGVPDTGMYTVSLGMYKWLEREQIQMYFTTFCAAAIIVAAPITALFMWLQKYYVAGVTGGAVKG